VLSAGPARRPFGPSGGVERHRGIGVPGGESPSPQVGEGYELLESSDSASRVRLSRERMVPSATATRSASPAPPHRLDTRDERRGYRTQPTSITPRLSVWRARCPDGLRLPLLRPFRDCSAAAWPGSVSALARGRLTEGSQPHARRRARACTTVTRWRAPAQRRSRTTTFRGSSAEKQRRGTQQQHPLGALRNPYLGREAQPFARAACTTRMSDAAEGDEARDHRERQALGGHPPAGRTPRMPENSGRIRPPGRASSRKRPERRGHVARRATAAVNRSNTRTPAAQTTQVDPPQANAVAEATTTRVPTVYNRDWAERAGG